MGRPPCCDKAHVKKGPWTEEEDAKLLAYTSAHGTGNWTSVPQRAGLKRCGKSCRLRYTNYLRPNLKHDNFTPEEEEHIVTLHELLGSRWSLIARQLPGRTDNGVKNYWNTKLSKKLRQRGIDPVTHRPLRDVLHSIGSLGLRPSSSTTPTQAGAAHLTAATPLPLHPYASAPDFSPELRWSDFLSDNVVACHDVHGAFPRSSAAAAAAAVGDVVFGPEVVMDGEHDEHEMSTASTASFIDAILDRDKEMAATSDELISELLADPSCGSSQLRWDYC